MEPNWAIESWNWDPISLSAQPNTNVTEMVGVQPEAPYGAGTLQAAAPVRDTTNKPAANQPGTKRSVHKPSCQVVGCNADLQCSRAYYRRYRICENHFRMPSFSLPSVLNGVVCRFCQQCAKFEPITEFEGDKRSCRRQLNRHNERRKGRKGTGRAGAKPTKQAGAEPGAASGAEDDNSGDSNSGRLVDGPLAELLQSSSIQRSSAGATAFDAGEVYSRGLGVQPPTEHPSDPGITASMHSHLMGMGEGRTGTTTPALGEAVAVTQAWEHGPLMHRESPHGSMSEVTVEVGQPMHGPCGMVLGDGFDVVLTAAAQELLAHWQEEEDTGLAAAQQVSSCVEAVGSSDGRMLQATAQAMQQQQQKPFDAPSADSSVHGPSALSLNAPMRHGYSKEGGEDRVLEVLRQSQRFETIRADARPLVQDVASVPLLQQQQSCQPHLLGSEQHDLLQRQPRQVAGELLQPSDMGRQHLPGLSTGRLPDGRPQQPQPLQPHHDMVPEVLAQAAVTLACTSTGLPRPVAVPQPHATQPFDYPAPAETAKQEASPFPPSQYPPHALGALNTPRMGSSPPAPKQLTPWLSHHFNTVAASLVSSAASNNAAMHEAVHQQHQQQLRQQHQQQHWGAHAYPEPSAQSFSPPPQVPLHPLLANLPPASEAMRPSAPQQARPANPPAPALASQASMPPPTLHYGSSTYPNIWSAPCPLPAPAAPLVPCNIASHLPRPPSETARAHQHQGGSMWQGAGSGGVAAPPSPPSLSQLSGHSMALDGPTPSATHAAGTLARHLGQASYLLAEQSLTRLSIKLHGVTPDALPAELRSALTEWLAATDVRLLQGFIRPGCVHLSLDCVVINSKADATGAGGTCAGGGVQALDHLLQAGLATAGVARMASALPRPLARLFSSCTIVELQSPSKLVLMEGEAVWSVAALEKRPTLPQVHTVQPLAILAGSRAPTYLYLQGSHLEGRAGASASSANDAGAGGCQVLVRSQGRFWQRGAAAPVQPMADSGRGSVSATDGGKASWWRVGVNAATMQPGLAVVECQTGRLLSNWRPVLVLDDAGVHREVLQLQPLQCQFLERINAIICDLALLLQLQSQHQQATAAAYGAPQGGGDGAAERRGEGRAEDTEDVDESGSDLLTDDDQDDQSLTAPSISDDGGDDAEVEGGEEMDGQLQEDGPLEAGRRLAMASAHPMHTRMVSWDSETFAEANTPAVHSSWGSTHHTSMLAAAMETGQPPAGDACTPVARSRPLRQTAGPFADGRPATDGDGRPAPAPAAAQPSSSAFTAEVRASLVAKAMRLLAFACDAGWPCTARLLLDLLTSLPLLVPAPLAGVQLAQVCTSQLVPLAHQAVLAAAVGGDGLTVLHRAARSGSAATVHEVLNFAQCAGLTLNPASRGAAPMSALHLAAACAEGNGAAARVLLRGTRDAPVQWFVARDAEGHTPAQVAASQGSHHINDEARWLVQLLAARH